MGKKKEPKAYPYINGTVLSIRGHVPSPPFGFKYGLFYGESPCEWNDYQGEDGFSYFRDSQLSYVFDHPPIATVPPDPEKLRFKIMKTIIGPKHRYFDLRDNDYISDTDTSDTEGQDNNESGDEVVEYDPNYFVPGLYYSEDLLKLRRKDRHLLLDNEPYNGAIVVVGKIQLPADRAPGKYVAKIFGGAYYLVSFYRSWTFALPGSDLAIEGPRWVRMVLLDKLDAIPISKIIRQSKQPNRTPLPSKSERLKTLKRLIDADKELWWWCQINYRALKPHDVLINKDDTVKIINFNQATLYMYDQDDRFLRHLRVVALEISEADLKVLVDRVSPVYWSWPFQAFTHMVPSWRLVKAPSRPWCMDRGNWEEWVLKSWLENPEEAGIWLLQSYQGDKRFSPLDEAFLDADDYKARSGRLLGLLEQLGRKSAVDLETIRLAELDETGYSHGDLSET